MNGYLTIGQVSKEVGLPAKTIRYYEDIQLLPPAKRMDNTYRKYSNEDIKKLRFIKQARTLGLFLSEIKELIEESFEGSCEHLKAKMVLQIPQYIASIKKRINDLQALQYQLEELQESMKTLHLTEPTKRVKDKECCEVLHHFEQTITKGGV